MLEAVEVYSATQQATIRVDPITLVELMRISRSSRDAFCRYANAVGMGSRYRPCHWCLAFPWGQGLRADRAVRSGLLGRVGLLVRCRRFQVCPVVPLALLVQVGQVVPWVLAVHVPQRCPCQGYQVGQQGQGRLERHYLLGDQVVQLGRDRRQQRLGQVVQVDPPDRGHQGDRVDQVVRLGMLGS